MKREYISTVVVGIILTLSTHVLADDTTTSGGATIATASEPSQTSNYMAPPAQPSTPSNPVVMTAQPVTQMPNAPSVPPRAYAPPPQSAVPYYQPPPRKQTRGPFQHVKNFFKSLAGME